MTQIELKEAISKKDHIAIFSLSNKLHSNEGETQDSTIPSWWYSKCKCTASIELDNFKYLLKCNDPECDFEKAYALYRLSKLSECFKIIEKHGDALPGEMLLLLAQCYYKDEQFTKSINHFASLYKSFSGSSEMESLIAVNYLAALYRASHPPTPMVQNMTTSCQSSYDVWHNLALVYISQGDHSNAIICMKKSLQLLGDRTDSQLQMQFIEREASSNTTILQSWTELLSRRDSVLSIASMLVTANNILTVSMRYLARAGYSTNTAAFSKSIDTALSILERFKALIAPPNIKSTLLNRDQIVNILFNASLFHLLHNPKRMRIANTYMGYIKKTSDLASTDPRILVLSSLLKLMDGVPLEPQGSLEYQYNSAQKDCGYIIAYRLLSIRSLFDQGQSKLAQNLWKTLTSEIIQYIGSEDGDNWNNATHLIRECASLMLRIDEDRVINELLDPIFGKIDQKSPIYCYCLALKGEILSKKLDISKKLDAIECYKQAIMRFNRGMSDMRSIQLFILLHLNDLIGELVDLIPRSQISALYEWLGNEVIPFTGIMDLVGIASSDKESAATMTIDSLLKLKGASSTKTKTRREDRMKRLLEKYGEKKDLPAKKNWSMSNNRGSGRKKHKMMQKKKKTGTQGMVVTPAT